MTDPEILITRSSADYSLLDSGEGEKLEHFGRYVLSRPDPQALWQKMLPPSEWKKADAYFGQEAGNKEKGEKGDWAFRKALPPKWPIGFDGLKFWIKPTAFKHVGLFPEQAGNWEWLRELISSNAAGLGEGTLSAGASGSSAAPRGEGSVQTFGSQNEGTLPSPRGRGDIEVLNLFGYTGGATLVCAAAGAKVVHIDGSKAAVAWARENAELSGLTDKPIRWIVEDARTFVEREIRRGRAYDGIVMDPPAFGHGPDNELWKIEEHFPALIEASKKLLKPQPLFFLINGYSAGYSAIAYENNLLPLKEKFGGQIEIGELAIEEGTKENGKKENGRLLPAGIFARWSAN